VRVTGLPEYFFRVRENGAFVFRVVDDARQRRLDMDQIAVVNVRNGEIKAHGDRSLSAADRAAIDSWLDERRAVLARREQDEIQRTIDQINLAAHWAQSKATDAQLDQVTEALLLAMHDLRSVLVRRKADRLTKPRA
jgi:hypothetical protein